MFCADYRKGSGFIQKKKKICVAREKGNNLKGQEELGKEKESIIKKGGNH